VAYGRVPAIRDLSLHIDEGELVGLVGHNGAGKTTTLMAITGVVPISNGDVNFDGKSIRGKSPEEILRLGIALVPENRDIFTRLTVEENLRIGACARRDKKQIRSDIDRAVTDFPVLGRFLHSSAAGLSGGEQQQLAIARALLSNPRLLLLDEPSLGLAPRLVDRIFEIMAELRDRGTTMLLVEQNVRRTLEVAARTYVMRAGGQIAFHGTPSELSAVEDFDARYLGLRVEEPSAVR
jgi:branched-chain amino acid transport system ATP-binding protein